MAGKGGLAQLFKLKSLTDQNDAFSGEDTDTVVGKSPIVETMSRKKNATKVHFSNDQSVLLDKEAYAVTKSNSAHVYVAPLEISQTPSIPTTFLKKSSVFWAPKLKSAEFFRKKEVEKDIDTTFEDYDHLQIQNNFDAVIKAINNNIDFAKYLLLIPPEEELLSLHEEIRFSLDAIRDKILILSNEDLTLSDSLGRIKHEIVELDSMYKTMNEYVKMTVEQEFYLSQHIDNFATSLTVTSTYRFMLSECIDSLTKDLENLIIIKQDHSSIIRSGAPESSDKKKFNEFRRKLVESIQLYNETFKVISAIARKSHAIIKKSLDKVKANFDQVKNDRQRLFYMQYSLEKYLQLKYDVESLENKFNYLTQSARRSFSARYAMKNSKSPTPQESIGVQDIETIFAQLDQIKDRGFVLKRQMKEYIQREKSRMSKRTLIDLVQFDLMSRINAIDDEIDMAKEFEIDMKNLDKTAKSLGELNVNKIRVFNEIDSLMEILREKGKRDELKDDVMNLCLKLNVLVAEYGKYLHTLKLISNTFLSHIVRQFQLAIQEIMRNGQVTRESLLWFIRREDTIDTIKRSLAEVQQNVLNTGYILLDHESFKVGFIQLRAKIFMQKVSIQKSKGFEQSSYETNLLFQLEGECNLLDQLQNLNEEFKSFMSSIMFNHANYQKMEAGISQICKKTKFQYDTSLKYDDKRLHKICQNNDKFSLSIHEFFTECYELIKMLKFDVFKDKNFEKANKHYQRLLSTHAFVRSFKSEISDIIEAEFQDIRQIWEPAEFFKVQILSSTTNYSLEQLEKFTFTSNSLIIRFPEIKNFQSFEQTSFGLLSMMKSCSLLAEKVSDDLAMGLEDLDVDALQDMIPSVGRARFKYVDQRYALISPLDEIDDSKDLLRGRIELYKYDLMALRITLSVYNIEHSLKRLGTVDGKTEIVQVGESYVDEIDKHRIQLRFISKKEINHAFESLKIEYIELFQAYYLHLSMIKHQLEFCIDDLLSGVKLESITQDIYYTLRRLIFQQDKEGNKEFFKSLFVAFYQEIDLEETMMEEMRSAMATDKGIAMEYHISALYKCNNREFILSTTPNLLGVNLKKDIILKLSIEKDRKKQKDVPILKKIGRVTDEIVEDQLRDAVLILVVKGDLDSISAFQNNFEVEFKEMREGFRSLFNAGYEVESLKLRVDHLDEFYGEVTRESIKKVKHSLRLPLITILDCSNH